MSTSTEPVGEDATLRTSLSVCGGSASFVRTFELFWRSAGSDHDQLVALRNFIGDACVLRPSPQR